MEAEPPPKKKTKTNTSKKSSRPKARSCSQPTITSSSSKSNTDQANSNVTTTAIPDPTLHQSTCEMAIYSTSPILPRDMQTATSLKDSSSLSTSPSTPSQNTSSSVQIAPDWTQPSQPAIFSPHHFDSLFLPPQKFKKTPILTLIEQQVEGVKEYISLKRTHENFERELPLLNRLVANLGTIATVIQTPNQKYNSVMLNFAHPSVQRYYEQISNKSSTATSNPFKQAANLVITPSASNTELSQELPSLTKELPASWIKQINEIIEKKIQASNHGQLQQNLQSKSQDSQDTSQHITPTEIDTLPQNISLQVTSNPVNETEEEQESTQSLSPPSIALQAICLIQAKKYWSVVQSSEYTPMSPSALWIASFDNRKITDFLDPVYYNTIPGVTSVKSAWPNSLAVKVNFQPRSSALLADAIFARNIKNLPEEVKSLIHYGVPSFGGWKFFEIRSIPWHVDNWERVMNTANLNDPKALNALTLSLCQLNKGKLWYRDIKKPYITYDKKNHHLASLVLKVGCMTFDFHKLANMQNTLKFLIEEGKPPHRFSLVYNPYYCWGCYKLDHLKNDCPTKETWPPKFKNGEHHCDLCHSMKLPNTKHKVATEDCSIFKIWTENLKKHTLHFRGGY